MHLASAKCLSVIGVLKVVDEVATVSLILYKHRNLGRRNSDAGLLSAGQAQGSLGVC